MEVDDLRLDLPWWVYALLVLFATVVLAGLAATWGHPTRDMAVIPAGAGWLVGMWGLIDYAREAASWRPCDCAQCISGRIYGP